MINRIITLILLALAGLGAQAQSLTSPQLAALCTAVKAAPTLDALRTGGNVGGLLDGLNAAASPSFIVKRTSISRHEILTATSSIGSTFAWAGAGYITRSQGERDAFREMFNSTGTVNPSLPSIEAAFADIFSGAGGAANRAHIAALSKRQASFYERVFATGAGSDASPGALVVEGPASGAVAEWLVNPANCQ